MDLRKALVQSRKLPAQHIESIWENVYKHNVRLDSLSAILAFYLHHRVYPPPVQKAFDTLLVSFTDTKGSRRLRTLLFQTVEEMCHWLGPSCVTDTVRLSINPSVVVDLLPCFLINKDIPHPDTAVYERLISALSSPGLSQEDRAKVLCFLLETVPPQLRPVLDTQLTIWLAYSRTSQSTGSLFRTADVTEVDGSPAMGICTVLALVTTVTDLHFLSVVAFSNIRRYLRRSPEPVDGNLISAVLSYCSTLLAQTAKRPNIQHDKTLIAAILEEVVLVVSAVRDVDTSCRGRCQLIIGNIKQLAEQLKLTCLLVSVWDYHLTDAKESSLTERMLGSIISAEYSQGMLSHRLATVVAAHASLLSEGASTLTQHTPSLLRLVATHPSALVEEFLDIVPHLGSNTDLLVEVVHCLLDLPLLSASICVSQSGLLVQAGFKVPTLTSVKQLVEGENYAVYSHIMRTKATAGETEALLKLYPVFWTVLRPALSLGLVEVCSQVTPLLLDSLLQAVSGHAEANCRLVPALLTRVPLLCPLPAYQKAIYDVLPQYFSEVFTLQPDLLDCCSVAQFLSVTSHPRLCPSLLNTIVSSVGEQARGEKVTESLFETLDALLREMLMDVTALDMSLVTSICTTLAKLASRHMSLVPRSIAAFEKLFQTLQSSTEEEKEQVSNHARELIRILKNPRVASVVLSPNSKEDVAMAALIRVLFQFLD